VYVTRQMRVGVVFAAIAVAVYALMWVGFRAHWGWLDSFDTAVLKPLHHYGGHQPGWVRFWNVFCTVLGPTGFHVLGTVVIVIALLRRNLRAALFLVVTVWVSGVVTNVAKSLAHRRRPTGALVHAAFSSYPSGHALEVSAAMLALLTVSAGLFRHSIRVTTIVVGALIVISVGVGRVVLNVHYPSDVLGGWALGYLWFFLCLLVIRPLPLAARAAPDADLIGAATDERPEARDTAR
jgi:membrane-associated phospholipid phosphatase